MSHEVQTQKAPVSTAAAPVQTVIQRRSFSSQEGTEIGNESAPSIQAMPDISRTARLGHNFSQISIQPKLTIGKPGDAYEQEADSTAAKVMSMPAPEQKQEQSLQQKPLIQRQEGQEDDKVNAKPLTNTIQQMPLLQQATLSSTIRSSEDLSVKRSSASKLIQLTPEQNSEELNHPPSQEEAADIGQKALQTVGYEKIIKTALEAGYLRETSSDKSANIQPKLQADQTTIFRQAAVTAGQIFTQHAVTAGVTSQLDSPAPGPGDVIAIGILVVGLARAGYVLMSSKGTPGNNQAQNKQFNDAVREIEKRIGRKLSKDEIRRLHDAISGQDYGYHDIVEEGVGMFG